MKKKAMMPKKNTTRKSLTKRQEDALKRHKEKGTHTTAHIAMMRKLMKQGKTFTEAHRETMKKLGK
tara:strand:+ start:41 stop:238 length:198 start_codon:yes stop_codon:yes gene_type:complete